MSQNRVGPAQKKSCVYLSKKILWKLEGPAPNLFGHIGSPFKDKVFPYFGTHSCLHCDFACGHRRD